MFDKMLGILNKIKLILKKEQPECRSPPEFFEGKIAGYRDHDKTLSNEIEYYCSAINRGPIPGGQSTGHFFFCIGYTEGYNLYNGGTNAEEFEELLNNEGYEFKQTRES